MGERSAAAAFVGAARRHNTHANLLRSYQALRALPAHIPLILLIGPEEEIAWLEYVGLRADDYLRQPLCLEEVGACVQALLRSNKRKDQPSAGRAISRAITTTCSQ